MGMLDPTEMAESIWQAFQGELLVGTLRQSAVNMARGFDDYNDPVAERSTDYEIQGFIDFYTDYDRAQAGIPAIAVKFCFFANSVPGVTPRKDDTGQFRGQWYRFITVETDPAIALWTCQAFALDGEPTDGC
jgi:hypothetical protein